MRAVGSAFLIRGLYSELVLRSSTLDGEKRQICSFCTFVVKQHNVGHEILIIIELRLQTSSVENITQIHFA